MDDGDRGLKITEKLRAWAVEMQLKRPKESGLFFKQCMDCGEEISEDRRKAQPGCKRCVECQEFYERGKPFGK